MITDTTAPINILNAYTYETFKDLIFSLAENSDSSGEVTAERIAATKINAQRIKRIEKQCELHEELVTLLRELKQSYLWVMIAESWCGDGAQCIPVISKIARESSFIELKVILRDQNPLWMDNYLTNNKRAIPKLICINKDRNKVIWTWGPRPKAIEQLSFDFKNTHPEATHEEFVTNLHLWYAKDKTKSIQNDFMELLKNQI